MGMPFLTGDGVEGILLECYHSDLFLDVRKLMIAWRKGITDSQYGMILGGLYIYQSMMLVWASQETGAGSSFWNSFWYLTIFWIGFTYISVYSDLSEMLNREVEKKRSAFNPVSCVKRNWKIFFLKAVLPLIEGMVVILVLWLILGWNISRNPDFDMDSVLRKYKKLFVIMCVGVLFVVSWINKNLIFPEFPALDEYDFEDDDDQPEIDHQLVRAVLGKHTSNLFMVMFISTAVLSGMIMDCFMGWGVFFYWALLYLFLFCYCLYYCRRKFDHIPIKRCLLGALPFGFIILAHTPQTTASKEGVDHE